MVDDLTKVPVYHGTVKPTPNYNPEADAEKLRKAMKGFGTDEKAIVEVVGSRTCQEMKAVETAFKTFYGKDLVKDLKSEISGHFLQVVLYRIYTRAEFDAFSCNQAIKGAGTDEAALIEIFASRKNSEIKSIKEEYRRMYQKDLEKETMSDTSGHFKRLLVSLLQGNRDESGKTDPAAAAADAQALYKAGEAKWGTDESKFNQIFCSRGFPQLQLVFDEYQKLTNHGIEKAIDREMSGDLKKGMLALVKCCRNTPEFFAEKLYHSMKGMGTDDKTLIRIVVSRCEVDMVEIKEVFLKKYNKTLASMIESDTSGDYKKILVKLIS